MRQIEPVRFLIPLILRNVIEGVVGSTGEGKVKTVSSRTESNPSPSWLVRP
ncbi:MAG: hypothetical protein MUC92_01710 [Fimbriimonadaceae bacterium]|nr:hypothetical protein [Fimbriimonadaceae bacterium]